MAREASIGARGAVIAALAAFAAALPSASPAAGRSEPCKNATAPPGSVSRAKVRAAVLCLIDRARTRRDVDELEANADLDDLGQRHANRMVAKTCFRHRCGKEAPVKQRFEQSPYVKGASSFQYSEELGYEATPRKMVKRLLAAGAHRDVILDPDFKDLGVGARRGRRFRTPRAGSS